MSDYYCHAGKCECERYVVGDIRRGCNLAIDIEEDFERCPWPSLQVRTGEQVPEIEKIHKRGFTAGIDAAIGAVEKLQEFGRYDFHIDEIIAALSALKKEE